MRFIAKAVPAGDFDSWVAQVRGSGSALDLPAYAALAKPSIAVPPRTYRSVEPKLFERIIEQTVSGSQRARRRGLVSACACAAGRRLRCWAI